MTSTTFAVRYTVFDKDDRRVQKQKEFKTEDARTKWCDKQAESANHSSFDAWSNAGD